MTASLKISGFKELDVLLASMPGHLRGTGVSEGMRRALKPVADAARAYAPVSLDRSIAVSSRLKPSQVGFGQYSNRVGMRVMYVGSKSPLAHLFEFGTGPRSQTTTGRFVGIMPPDPFLRPAWDAHKDEVLRNLSEEIRKAIAEAVSRRARKAAAFIGPRAPMDV